MLDFGITIELVVFILLDKEEHRIFSSKSNFKLIHPGKIYFSLMINKAIPDNDDQLGYT